MALLPKLSMEFFMRRRLVRLFFLGLVASAVWPGNRTSIWTPLDSSTCLEDPERSGCCSRHGGVCGCDKGRAVCCDTTKSPSCGC